MRKALAILLSLASHTSALALGGGACMFMGLATVAIYGKASAEEPGQALPEVRCEIHVRADDGTEKIVAVGRTCEEAAARVPLYTVYRYSAMYPVPFGQE